MALFGYPVAQENDAERAVRAALVIQRALAELNRKNAVSAKPALAARTAIASGPVVVDVAGEIYGDVPNIAARAQALAEPGAVVVTARVQRQVSGLFVAEERGTHTLKGVPEPVTLYRLIRAKHGLRSVWAGRREAVTADFDGGAITSDAGGLLLGSTDRAIGLVEHFAACFADRRMPELIEHRVRTLVGQRVFGIALGYEDLNDHGELRRDPLMATLAGKLAARRKDCAPLAGKSTLNRLELSRQAATRYHKISHDGAAIETLFVALFLEAHRVPPRQIVLALDATDDPLCGHQEGRFFHGYYDCYCYLPLYVFCGRHLLAAKLRPSNIDGSAGAIEEVARIIGQIRARWPKTRILLRANSGFAREALMAWCEMNRVGFVFGLARNPRLVEEIAVELLQAEAEASATGKPARRRTSTIRCSTAGSAGAG